MRTPRSTLVGTFALAFCVRLAWLLEVQHPMRAVYSDMAGYVDRAEQLMWHLPSPDPRILAIYPWGTHALMAAEFLLLGRHGEVAIAVAHALVGAVPAPCMAALSMRLVPSRPVAALTGVLVALWYPQVAFAGFFLSEHWFAAAIAVHAAWTVRDRRGPVGLLATGLVSAIAFVVRPQFIVTWALDTTRLKLSALRRGGLWPAVRKIGLLALPVAIFAAGSAVRLHALSGHWGLISENDQMTRIWADTDICRLTSSWTLPGGGRFSYWFSPPSKPALRPGDTVDFEGFIADPDILKRIRQERLRGVPWTARLRRRLGNVALLFTGNLPWPESNYREPPWRLGLQRAFAATILYAGLPLAALGVALGRRSGALFIAALNAATCIVTAFFFFGEGRYHVPYDPFFVLLAVAGGWEIVGRSSARLGSWRRGRIAGRAAS
jgi:hypothetical protein